MSDLVLPDPPEWMERALCAQTDPEAFYPEVGDSSWQAKQICQRCPVTGECLRYALANRERHGIWGGKTPKQREQIRRGRPEPARVTHCPNNHEYTPENTYINPRHGRRQCRTCMSIRQVRVREKAAQQAAQAA